MARTWRMGGAMAVALAGAALVGCFVITGGTSGYQVEQVDAGQGTSPSCTNPDGGTCVELNCVSNANCNGDAGEVCCLKATGTFSSFGAILTSAVGSCQTACSGKYAVQLCALDSGDCPLAACVAQPCFVNGSTLIVNACGALPCPSGP